MERTKTSVYEKSNLITEVSLKRFSKEYSKDILSCDENYKDRQKASEKLLKYLSEKFKISTPTIKVVNGKRKQKGSAQIYGTYHVQAETIFVYNQTAKTNVPISIKSFYDTLLHEFMHHYDHKYLKMNDSLHTSGFYKRITDLKTKLG